jgi:hypothetical protein
MRVKALNAIKFAGEMLKTGSVFEVDIKTGEKLFARGHVEPSTAACFKVPSKSLPGDVLIKKLGTPIMGQPNKKK